ncbi:MAG: HtaA domain-containing protein [Actinomycetota bacterium]|nr:HtaA domain-containing protein [Actinomycetota bacterium]
MRVFKRVAVVAMAAGLLAGLGGAATASAATSSPTWAPRVWLTGGDTSVTTAPGLAAALLGHDIVPIATLPGTEGAQIGGSGVSVRFTFPVTGGWLNAAALRGTIRHQGGILFIDPATGRQIEVSNFIINVHQGVLTAEVNGNPKVRVPLLRLSLAHAKIHAGWHYVQISGIVLRLTATAAGALDSTFSTTLFKPGLELGTASTLVRFS